MSDTTINPTVLERVAESIQIQMKKVDPGAIRPDVSLREGLGADSLDMIGIVMGAEEEFEVEISDDEVEHIGTVGDLAVLISRKIGEAGR